MADLLDRVQRELDERLAELRPLVEEARQLEAALQALERDDTVERAPSSRGRRPLARPASAEDAATDEAPVSRADSSAASKRRRGSKPKASSDGAAREPSAAKQATPAKGKAATKDAPAEGAKLGRPPKGESDERRRRVLAILADNPGTTAGNLALLLDTSVAAMGALLKRLEREGQVERAEKGYSKVQTPDE